MELSSLALRPGGAHAGHRIGVCTNVCPRAPSYSRTGRRRSTSPALCHAAAQARHA